MIVSYGLLRNTRYELTPCNDRSYITTTNNRSANIYPQPMIGQHISGLIRTDLYAAVAVGIDQTSLMEDTMQPESKHQRYLPGSTMQAAVYLSIELSNDTAVPL